VEISPQVDLSTKQSANTGLGKASCIELAKHNPEHLYLLCRSAQKAATAIEDIKKTTPNANVSFIECDLSSLASVKKAAEEFISQSTRLDVLMCNAGICWDQPGLTVDGYEKMFGTNHLGHALLIKLLLPTLLKTANELDSDVRIVILSSSAHANNPNKGILFNDLKTAQAKLEFFRRYGQSKLANVLYARSLAQKFPNIKTVSIHPGVVDTDMNAVNNPITRDSRFWHIYSKGYHKVAKVRMLVTGSGWLPVEEGAKNQLWAATGAKEEVVSGTYYVPIAVVGKDSKLSKNEKLGSKLWDWTEAQLEEFLKLA
jgi:NAD(P)-dependent dehydrogenase (short-subunit alcohol dehydrogenase family)